MTSIKVKFRPSTNADCMGTVYYQIIHERKQRLLFSPYHVFPSEWDESRAMVPALRSGERRSTIRSIRQLIQADIMRLTRIVRKLDSDGLAYSAEDVVCEFRRHAAEYSLFKYMEGIILSLRLNNKVRTAETYVSALSSFKKFRKDEDIMLDTITTDIMESYQAWLQKKGMAPNTISFYIRILRAVYNRAVDDEVIENRRPFRRVYTGIDRTQKRALSMRIIRQLKILDLSSSPALDFARDMFMMSFMLRGMSFIDMAFLKKSDLEGGHVSYRRRKTGRLLNIKWTKEMQQILAKYPENNSPYLLPIIRKPDINELYAYRNAGYNINYNLKRIAALLGISMPLTLYVARHSWASAAKNKGVPLSVISEGMGHESETTTQIYLASLDTTLIDRANSLILKSL